MKERRKEEGKEKEKRKEERKEKRKGRKTERKEEGNSQAHVLLSLFLRKRKEYFGSLLLLRDLPKLV